MGLSDDTVADLRRRKEALENRLNDGYVRIGEAEIQGKDIEAWTQFWLSLLGEYENIADELHERGEG